MLQIRVKCSTDVVLTNDFAVPLDDSHGIANSDRTPTTALQWRCSTLRSSAIYRQISVLLRFTRPASYRCNSVAAERIETIAVS